jgi:hypothetical protein
MMGKSSLSMEMLDRFSRKRSKDTGRRGALSGCLLQQRISSCEHVTVMMCVTCSLLSRKEHVTVPSRAHDTCSRQCNTPELAYAYSQNTKTRSKVPTSCPWTFMTGLAASAQARQGGAGRCLVGACDKMMNL